jgi:3-oxoacyl-[acyl-carrier-protein] synthase II
MGESQVVITGVGPVSAAGIGRDEFLRGVSSGEGFVGPLSLFPTDGLPCSTAAEVKGLNLSEHLASEKTYLDRCSEFALASASLALRDARLTVTDDNRHQVGVCLGSMYGCLGTMRTFYERLLTKGAKFANSLVFSHSYVNTPISLVAIEFGIQGYHCTYSNGLTSGLTAIAHAHEVLRSGQAQVLLAGGTDALCETLFRALCDAGTLAPEGSVQGWRLGEGAGMLVLETEQHARDRGAHVLATLAGLGMANDLDLDGSGPRRTMQQALDGAELTPDDVGSIYLSANGSGAADEAERVAVAELFGGLAPARHALKSRLGEPLAAGGPLCAIAALGGIESGATALVTSVDPGGGCVSLAIQRGEGADSFS